MNQRIGLTLVALVAASMATAQRMPTVNYTVSGSSGNWVLDFSVTNNFFSTEGSLYFFGVLLATGNDVVGSPTNWDPTAWPTWDNTPYGGSSTIYNNNWLDFTFTNNVAPGSTLSGFQARTTAAVAPTSVQWFAYGYGGVYGGNDYFNADWNPGFEGTAGVVPEPATMAALGLGVAALIRRRRR